MSGIATQAAFLGWHGLNGDRRFAFRRLSDSGGFPWLNASRLPEILLYQPLGIDESTPEPAPTHVRTPEGETLELRSPALQENVAQKFGSAVELMNLKNGTFDDADVSIISLATVSRICREAERDVDTRRFRPNIVIASDSATPFAENDWLGRKLIFGDDGAGPIVSVTLRDARCMMINLDPDTAQQDPRLMKAAVRLNGNNAGVYGAIVRAGEIRVGQQVRLVD